MTRTRRQSRRQSDYEDAGEETAEIPSAQPAARSSFTPDDMASIMTALQQSQTAAFERLLERVLEHETRRESLSSTLAAAPTPAAAPAPALLPGNFAKCTARYSGAPDDSLDGFIDAMESYKDCAYVSDDNALRGLSMLLTGDAAVWWQGIKSTISSWSEAVTSLRSAFGDTRPPHRIYRELFNMSQGREKTEIFVAKARTMFARLPIGDLSTKVQLDMVYGLLHHRVRERLRRDEFSSYETLLHKARQIEDASDEVRNDYRQRPRTPQHSAVPAGEASQRKTTPRESRRETASNATGPTSKDGVAPGNSTGSTASSASDAASSSKRKFCSFCKRHGHNRDNCFKLKSNDNVQESDKIPICYGCNTKGVTRSQCSKCNADHYAIDVMGFSESYSSNQVQFSLDNFHNNNILLSRSRVTTTLNDSVSMNDSGHFSLDNVFDDNNISSSPSRVTTTLDGSVTINGQGQFSLDDTFDNGIVSPPSRANLRNEDRLTVGNTGQFSTVNIAGKKGSWSHSVEHQARLRPTLSVQILGVRGKGLLDSGAKSSVAGALLHKLLLAHQHPCEEATRRVRLADGSTRTRQVLLTTLEVRITPERSVKLQFTIFPDAENNETLLGMDFLVAAGIVLDFASSTWHFAGEHVFYDIEYEHLRPYTNVSAADLLRYDEGLMLCPEQRQVLSDLLQQNSDVFAEQGKPTPYAEHHIDTGDHPPISVPPYRLTPAKKELMKAELEKMLTEGVIEECESAWTSPAVLVPKKDGKVRFCVDYRKLNAITKTDAYPMPLIDDLVQSTKRNCFMSTLDLRSGFWQVVMKESDKDKTAFQTPFGTYRFTRMPFGLKNAPSTFQRLIDKLRSSLNRDFTEIEGENVTLLAYQDDLLLITETYVGHIAALQAVFEKLRAFGLRANREKCVFCRKQVKYLGHVITQDGVSPDYDKVQAIVDMKPPQNLKQLRTYLQTCSWFRKFVPNFSAIAEPLTRLTKKNQTWVWEAEQATAYEELKQRLTSAPILVQADYSQPFVLRTDASNYALGAVLLQGEGVEERPIEYASRLLNPAEKNYSTTEREALAVVWAVERFRGYIDGHEVIVRSDHQPLKWLLTIKSPSGRLVRWALKLQSFNITYQYTPGKANVVADTLSRPPCSREDGTEEEHSLCHVVINLPSTSPADLRAAQAADTELYKIIQDLENPDELTSSRWLERGYVMSHGVLYRYDPDSDAEDAQLVVPSSMRDEILKEFHDSPTAGHQGVERTLHRLKEKYYFPGMRRYVTEYLKKCVDCLRYKPSNQKPVGLLQTPMLQQRGEVLAIDLFGPLPTGDQGERWIFLIEDVATRWVELFPLVDATAEACSRVLLEEYFLRYGLPRRVISDNGTQFVSAVMQQCMHLMGVKQELIPLYHPEANPAERKNRDLKVQLSMLVQTSHTDWPKHLASVRFAMNSAVCSTTGKTPAYLTFARELRTPFDVNSDLRSILDKENFVPQVTPYLRSFISSLSEIRERAEKCQDIRKKVADDSRQKELKISVGDLVLLKSHHLSNASKGITRKFMPRRDGPYRVRQIVSPTTFVLADLANNVIGKYHSTDITLLTNPVGTATPVMPKRRRGRPRDRELSPKLDSGRDTNLEGECVAREFKNSRHSAAADSANPAASSGNMAERREHARRTRLPARYRD
ncbi:hypothetical protein PYW08_006366 [Mythimna loreyi]|uniref:Uncharacterized protein n=1 Tax=Mythimna loreyi TaxID=667449 RepID=A0ACC2QPK5_9NEOP|nr:hypothetical protein PYW08_006366 [Mythimna loreyi]